MSVALTATASDNVGVAGVQFKVDGATVGAEDMSSPYAVTWDSTSVADGSHTIVAVARDASGNSATSTGVTVTTSNFTSAGSADLYWVGGSGNWSDARHWAISSGGAGHYLPPTTANIVHFDGSSSASSYTVTFDTAATTATMTVANPATGSPRFAGSAAWTNSGGLTLVAGMGWTYTGPITFSATTAGKTITTAGVTLSSDLTFNGSGGGWTLQDNTTDNPINTITLTSGTLNTNAKTVTTGKFSVSGSTARTFTGTNSTFNLTGTGTVWDATTITSLTRTLTGSTINLIGTSATFAGGGITTYATTTLTGGGAMVISGTNAFVNLTVQGTASLNDSLQLNGSQTVSGTIALSGYSQTQRLFIKSNSNSAARTVTAANVSMSNVGFFRITGAGTGSWTGISIADGQGNSGITFTSAVTRYWVGNSGNWSDQSHWSTSSGGSSGASMPLPQDTAIFDANSITSTGRTITLDESRYGAIDFSAVSNAPVVSIPSSISIYGNLTLASDANMTLTFGNIENQAINWLHLSGTKVLTSNGNTQLGNINMGAATSLTINATLQLGDDLHLARQLTHTSGIFDANNHSIYTDQFRSNGTSPRTVLMGSGTWQMSDANGQIWVISATGLTLNAGTSKILFGSINNHTTPTQNRQFTGGGLTYYDFEWSEQASPYGLDFNDGNTFHSFSVTNGSSARSLTFPAGTTSTFASFTTAGVGQLSITSKTGGSTTTLSSPSGTNTVDNALIKDVTATGGATWNATNSQDGGNNSGWVFQ